MKVWDARSEVDRLFDQLGIASPEARSNLDTLASRLDDVPDEEMIAALKEAEGEP
jgi:hypothetical protein